MSAAGSDLSDDISWLNSRWDVPGKHPVRLRYAILGSDATGSAVLARRLRDLGLGVPFPYLDGDFVPKMATRLGCWDMYGNMDVEEYLEHVSSVRTTPNGVFGIEVNLNHARGFARAEPDKPGRFWANFDKVVSLHRPDRVMHAVVASRRRAQRAEPAFAAQNLGILPLVGDTLGLILSGERIALQIAKRVPPGRSRIFEYEGIDDAGRLMDLVRWLVEGRSVQPPELPDNLTPLLPAPPAEDVELRSRFLAYLTGEQHDPLLDV